MENELDAIYIETTGAAHPVEVLDGIMSPLFAEELEYKGIITVVDLLRWKRSGSVINTSSSASSGADSSC